MKQILFCKQCSVWTLKVLHDCNQKAFNVEPPKYSPEDKYGNYRRIAKSDERRASGLIN